MAVVQTSWQLLRDTKWMAVLSILSPDDAVLMTLHGAVSRALYIYILKSTSLLATGTKNQAYRWTTQHLFSPTSLMWLF